MYRLSFVSAFAVLLWVLGFIVYLPVWQAGMEDYGAENAAALDQLFGVRGFFLFDFQYMRGV